MGYGLAFLAIGFLVLAVGARIALGGVRVSMMWLILTYLLHTVGELCLSPVGLSSVTKLAPRRLVGQMMGTWFMGTALGNLIAGLAGGGFGGLSGAEMFAAVAQVTGIAGLILLVFSKPLKRLIGGAETAPDSVEVESQPTPKPATL